MAGWIPASVYSIEASRLTALAAPACSARNLRLDRIHYAQLHASSYLLTAVTNAAFRDCSLCLCQHDDDDDDVITQPLGTAGTQLSKRRKTTTVGKVVRFMSTHLSEAADFLITHTLVQTVQSVSCRPQFATTFL